MALFIRGLNAKSWKISKFEMQNFIPGCRSVSRNCKESSGGLSKLRKIAIGIHLFSNKLRRAKGGTKFAREINNIQITLHLQFQRKACHERRTDPA
jgi:hypothetical protein